MSAINKKHKNTYKGQVSLVLVQIEKQTSVIAKTK